MNNTFKTELLISGNINDELANSFIEQTDAIIDAYDSYLYETSHIKESLKPIFPTITVTINTCGGSVFSGNLLVSRIKEMQSRGIDMVANCVTAMSMGFIILLSFNKRKGSILTNCMNHGMSTFGGGGYIDEIQSNIDNCSKLDETYNNIIREVTTIPEEEIEISKLKCMYYDYDKCLEYNILNYNPEDKDTEIKEFSDRLHRSFNRCLSIFAEDMGVTEDVAEEMLTMLLNGEDDDEPCNEVSEDCYDCPHVDECFNHNLSMIKSCMKDNNCKECRDIQICNHDRAIMLEYMCDDIQDCDKCDNSDLCEVTDFETIYNNNKEELNDSECQAPHCSGDCCNCNLCDIEVEEDIEPEEHECDCNGSCDNCTCDKDNIPEILELDNVPPCYGEVSPQDEECLSCNFLNACCVKTKTELESCKDITKQEEGIECDKCEFKEECKEQLEFCDKVLNITNN